ncbi:VWA domain-containing protein [Pseudomarimonas salicorniae]|uniref:VWA domain-containing protein n=1 Tax=Pseudomarimonas salicorniae TaxID=2933270 RepID=A0ABT0GJ44_9GAMM|nr:VWA domain-containing protein [Lysobacter sp. CAU 1642]MCK7594563.1 VWA domain-containing protein [Lysobacter sp. CAU 1642]
MAGLFESLMAFHFLRPLWLLALPLALLPWWLAKRGAAVDSPWARWVDPELLPHLLVDGPAGNSAGRAVALSALLIIASLALAGPAFRLAPQAEMVRESALVIALDLSAGMRAADVPPDRLSRARFEIADLLRERGDGQTAMIAFAGEAFTVAPLTDDASTLESLLSALEPDVMPVAGQRPERALRLAAELLGNAGHDSGDILLVTYAPGRDSLALAGELGQRGIRTSILLLGTDAGAPVPEAQGGFRSGEDGQLELAPRDLDGALAVARAGAGRVVAAEADDSDTQRLLAFWESAEARLREREEDGALRYVDEGPWLALLALLPALFVLRQISAGRAILFLGVGLMGIQSAPVRAEDSFWQGLWSRPDQRAWQALEEGNAARARVLAQTPGLSGAAAYREGDFAAAAEAFGAESDAVAHYNRGTALARAGRLEEALSELDAALGLDPDLDDARHNRDVVQRALEQQAAENESGEEGDPESGAQQGESEPGEAGEDAESEAGQDQADEAGAQGQPSERESDESAERESEGEAGTEPDAEREAAEAQRQAMEEALAEQQADALEEGDTAADSEAIEAREVQQASEQLLRKIPDDPGALLRRKFALEQRRRVLEGDQR